jgi:hypothetical protein
MAHTVLLLNDFQSVVAEFLLDSLAVQKLGLNRARAERGGENDGRERIVMHSLICTVDAGAPYTVARGA